MSRLRSALFALFLIGAILVAYQPVVHNDFVSLDDDILITANPFVLQGLTAESVSWAFFGDWGSNWVPLTWLSHSLDVTLFGLDPVGHHATSLAIHVANALLVFAFFALATRREWPALWIALLFAIHPQHVESVAWAAERKDVLSTFFGLLSLMAWLGFARAQDQRRAVICYAASFAGFAASLMSKPMLVTWPFVLLLFDYWPLARFDDWKRCVLEKVPFLAFALLLSWVAIATQGRVGAVGSVESFPLGLRLANAVVSYQTYLLRTLWPEGLTAFYPYPAGGVPAAELLVATAVLAAFSVVFLWFGRHRRYPLVGWLLYLGTLVPVIGLVQIGLQANADRYTYWPLLGVFAIAAYAVDDVLPQARRRVVWPVLCLLSVVLLVPPTRAQVRTWKDGPTLFRNVIAHTAPHYMPHYNLGTDLFGRGEKEEALVHFERAHALAPQQQRVVHNYGRTLSALGRKDEAREVLEQGLQSSPGDNELELALALVLQQQGELRAARLHYEAILERDPKVLPAHNNVGAIHLAAGRNAKAVEHFQAALRIDPRNESAYSNLRRAQKRLERSGAARTR